MTFTNRKALTAALILAFVSAVFAGAGEWKTAKTGDFSLMWMVDGANLNVKLSAPVEGWVAVGFAPTNKMKDANIIIGYVENGNVVIEDHFGNSPISHKSDVSADGKDNLTSISGTEKNGVTEISFTIPLNSGDPNDRVLVPGESYKVIFASYSKDKITIKHSSRTSTNITL
jgi:hypothetical protein